MTLLDFSKYISIQIALSIWVLISILYFYGAAMVFTLEVIATYSVIVCAGLITIGFVSAKLKCHTKYHYYFIVIFTSTVLSIMAPSDAKILNMVILPSIGFSFVFSFVFFAAFYLVHPRKN